jgi:hypothetical protein
VLRNAGESTAFRKEASLLIEVATIKVMMETLGKNLEIARKLKTALKLRIS